MEIGLADDTVKDRRFFDVKTKILLFHIKVNLGEFSR